MAKNDVTQGMPIDLSSLPPKCDHCALGKQSRSPVPKVREGAKASRRLDRVYVDLYGPLAVKSQAGNLYCMNIIDDFSGYVWSIPIRSKSDAFPALQSWLKAVTVQSGETLRILTTDNGELVSKSMHNWCQSLGIDHQVTAPYTSAHNGRVERLHRTISGKARTMRLACNAPGSLWDEFFQTAAYLTCLTATTSNLGRTPYERWFGRTPSLSHLREIGCRAFSLQQPSPSKIYARSNPCILIGYAPHSKAYRLWDPMSDRLFNSFHVTFTEHLEANSSPFQPGTILGTKAATSPPSWDVSGPAPPNSDTPSPSPFSSFDNNDASFFPQNNADLSSSLIPTIAPSIPAIEQRTITPTNNTVAPTNNTITPSNNTVTPSNNTTIPNNNNAPPSRNTVTPSNNTIITNNTAITNNSTSNQNITPNLTLDLPAPNPPRPLTITIPP